MSILGRLRGFSVGIFVLLVFVASVVSGAIFAPDSYRLSPTVLSIESSSSLPAEVQALEATGLGSGFDRDTVSELVLYDTASVYVDFDGNQMLDGMRIHNAAPYTVSVYASDGNNVNWSAVSGMQNVDLSVLADGWNSIDFAAAEGANKLRLDFTLISGTDATGLGEIEFWGTATHVVASNGSQVLDVLGDSDVIGQVRRLDAGGGALTISQNGNGNSSASFDLPYAASDVLRAWVSYDLKGVNNWMGVRRSINGYVAHGGYIASASNKWSTQIEEISPDHLQIGDNSISFELLAGFESDITVKNISVIVVLDDGSSFLATSGAMTALTDGDLTTGWSIPVTDGSPALLELTLAKAAAVEVLELEFDGAPQGLVTIEALRNNVWVAASGVDLSLASSAEVTVVGNQYRIALDGVAADGLRLSVSGAAAGSFKITEAVAIGSGTGETRNPEAIVLTWPQAGEFYGRVGFLRGFVSPAVNTSGAADLYIAGLPFDISGGEFEAAISKDQAGFSTQSDDEAWSVDIVALYPDGESVAQTVNFNAPVYDDNLNVYTPEILSEVFDPTEDKTVEHEGAELTVVAGALSESANITITPLRGIELAKLDTGLVNVTRGPRAGYRFLPHRNFNANVSLKLKFDHNRIPLGYTEDDVRIFYFDEEAGRWMALAETAIDAGNEQVSAQTDHFTDFIAGVVVAPESPQAASLNPTALKDIKVADPSAAINLISAPQGTNTGDANLSYPLELPAGRLGLAPSLSLQYSSAAQNGWMGLGWNLGMPEISIDTRWGVPRYDGALESETYTMAGQQLTPVAHREALVAREAERVFHTRVEGGFSRIIRHGDNPTNYWWEVTDKAGTSYFYGGDSQTGNLAPDAVLADAQGNVFRWALREVRDTNGNTVTYGYSTVQSTGLSNGTVLGSNLYIETINYTGDGTTSGPFEVSFIRDRELPAFAERIDTSISARGGFKMVTADLLKRVEVRFEGNIVRSYEFNYTEGAFFKTLLDSVTQYDAADNAFNTHTFEYFDEARDNGAYNGFASAAAWAAQNDNINLGSFIGEDASVLSGAEGTSSGGHLYVGFGLPGDKGHSIGVKVGSDSGVSNGRLILIDLNGDGLSDKVYFGNDGSIYFRENISGPSGSDAFSATEVELATLPALLREASSMSSRGIEGYFSPLTAGVNWSNSVSTSSIYFSDVNGDGLPDLVNNGAVSFNYLVAGVPTFTLNSTLTEAPVGSAAVDAAMLAIDFDDLFQELIDNTPLADSVRAWTAPFAGQVSLSGTVALIEDISPERANYTTADGVRVAIEHNGVSLWSLDIGETDYVAKVPGVTTLNVAKGDVIYFRTQSMFDGSYDQVAWDPAISYVGMPGTPDANGLDVYAYSASGDFVLAGQGAATISAPFDGTVQVSGTLVKDVATTDDVKVELLLNGVVIDSNTLAWNQTGSIVLSETVVVQKPITDANGIVLQPADQITLRVIVDSPIDLTHVNWSAADVPQVVYTVSTDVGLPSVNDGNNDPNVIIALGAGADTFPETNLTSPAVAWTVLEDGVHLVEPQISLVLGSVLDTDIVATVKRNGVLVDKIAIPVVAGIVAPSSLSLNVLTGEEYFIEFSSRTADVVAEIASSSVDITPPTLPMASVQTAFYGASAQTQLMQSYRGWKAFGYNGNRTRADLPVNVSAADFIVDPAELAATEAELQAAIDAGVQDDALVEQYEQVIFALGADPVNARWIGSDTDVWVSSSALSSSRQGENFVSVPDLTGFAAASGVPRISRTSTFAVNLGVSILSGNTSNSVSQSQLDFMDMNGDQFPDVVNKNAMVQYSPMIGGLEAAAQTVPYMSTYARETNGHASGLGIGGNFPSQTGNARGRMDVSPTSISIGSSGTQMKPLGFNIGIGDSTSEISYDLKDINADGLPDMVRFDAGKILVRFNLGYGFSALEEEFGVAHINDGVSVTTNGGLSLGFNNGNYGWGGGISGSSTTSNALQSLADINGDGLLDAVSVSAANANVIMVAFNSGSGFEPAVAWQTGGQAYGITNSLSKTVGVSGYVSIGFWPIPLVINPGLSAQSNMNRLETSIQDINGDGFPDYLHSVADDAMDVSYSTIGRTNMLRQVNRPLGSTVVLAYERNGNTYDQPQNRWVLARVEVHDGHVGDGEDLLVTSFAYADGYYDREEREFFGFATVVENHINYDSPVAESVYRIVTNTYLNDTYYEKGLLASSVTTDALGAVYMETVNTYQFIDISTGNPLATPDSLVATVFPQLIRTDSSFYEGQAVAGKSTYSTFAYDAFGNVTRFFDAANLNTTDDDVESVIGYHSDLAAYIIGKANAVVVTGNGVVMRQRQSDFALGTGNMTQLRSLLGNGSSAVTDMAYDGFGNLVSVTGPANDNGQRYGLSYQYDAALNTYVTRIEDSFGYISTATYDPRFGGILTSTDINGQPMTYELDDVGRITSVQGPYQAGSSLDTIRFEYHPLRDVPGDTQYENVDTSWALTEHIDSYRNVSDPIETVLFIDGLGRALQTKKDGAVFDGSQSNDRMIASGRIIFDHVGRQVEQYYPVDEPLGQASVLNTTFAPITPTITEYDILDRPVRVTIPDGTSTLMAYGFGADRLGQTQFMTGFTDAEGNSRETFADIRELMTSVKEINLSGGQPAIWTSYIYDPLSQITEVMDDQGNITTAAYDDFGRMVTLDSPDMGLTEFTYDLASNLIEKQTANLRAVSQSVSYTYDFQRLSNVTYPLFPDNNVAYTYGAAGALDNSAGRITLVTSQAGSEARAYGLLGEVIQTVKTIASQTQGNSGNSPEIYTTEYTFDTWNRLQTMIYPDGEILTNQYDSGGLLRRIDGTKAGFDYPYLREMGYDEFGQRVYMQLGNNTETTYAYVPSTRRLDGLVAGNSGGLTFQDLSYGYDLVGNIVTQANAAAVNSPNQLGGATSFTYQYDDLYRLTGATGIITQGNTSESFTLAMGYDSVHNITGKDQAHIRTSPGGTPIVQQGTTYDWAYTYAANQPHAPSLIGDRAYSYDANGNQTGWQNVGNGTNRTIVWDEENRIREIADNGHTMAYVYDDAGERVIKTGPQGETAYINQFYVVRNRSVATKHVFAGGSRLVSQLASQPDENGVITTPTAGNSGQVPWGWSNGNGGNNGNAGGNSGNNNAGGTTFEADQYFYHPDHLGSSSYVTDIEGEIFQHVEYFPFGETFFQESSNTQRTPYLFTGKELDEETGLYYFGARYYDPRTSVWQSADPILASYMSGEGSQGGVFNPLNLNLYGYVQNRPVVAVDPNGNQTIDCGILVPASACGFVGELAIGGIVAPIEVLTDGGPDSLSRAAEAQGDYRQRALDAAIAGLKEDAIGLGIAGVATRSAMRVSRGGLLGVFGFTRANKPVVLGVREHLGAFTERMGGENWRTWGGNNWQVGFNEVMNSGRPIKFNLDGIDSPGPWGAATAGQKPGARATEWELAQIYNNPDWWSRIEWYRDGVIVSNPFD